MDAIRDGVKAFNHLLPPVLAGYGTEILAGLLILTSLVVIILGWCCMRKRVKGRTVCLLGLMNSGKTLLFLQLKYGIYGPTQSSIIENTLHYEPRDVKNSRPITLVDIPGSERVRERIFNKYKEKLRGVVLLIDSLNFPDEAHDIAELLYDLLSDPTYHRTKAPFLVACNKQDMALATPKDKIMTTLEKEITQLQVSRKAKPSTLDGGPKAQRPVEFVKKGKDFHFTDLPSWTGVQFVGCSARGKWTEGDGKGMAKISEIRDWIDGLCY